MFRKNGINVMSKVLAVTLLAGGILLSQNCEAIRFRSKPSPSHEKKMKKDALMSEEKSHALNIESLKEVKHQPKKPAKLRTTFINLIQFIFTPKNHVIIQNPSDQFYTSRKIWAMRLNMIR